MKAMTFDKQKNTELVLISLILLLMLSNMAAAAGMITLH